MDLNWIKLKGYKRFESATLNTSGKVVAIVGPNEAGKSSLLEALQQLNDDNGLGNVLTRNGNFQDDDVVIEAGFLLDDSDREAISSLCVSEQARLLILRKKVNGRREYEVKHPLLQNSSPRTQLIEEQQSSLDKQVKEILASRIPQILSFNFSQRNLQSTYDLPNSVFSPPLLNLATLAKLDLASLRALIEEGNQPKIETLLRQANDCITDAVRGKWSRSDIKIRLSLNEEVLHILIEDEQQEFTSLDERSDGLRQFVALMNFLETNQTRQQPILLLDEAETHLHYDAQADLMNMFAKQQLASKIIYTTHSAGCLPEDLGTGVKLVFPIRNTQKSEINNCFWKNGRPGFSSLLFGMGASTLAFIPIRKAVFVEGVTDMLLLPTLFRQAINSSCLEFQTVFGISEASSSTLSLLKNEAPTVAFLVDNDKEGKNLIKKLKDAQIDGFQIFELPPKVSVLEDCICKELYLKAVNEELQDQNETTSKMSLGDLSSTGSPRTVEAWCKSQGIEPPSKRNIAYRLLGFATGERQEILIRSDLKQSFHDLYNDIIQSLSNNARKVIDDDSEYPCSS